MAQKRSVYILGAVGKSKKQVILPLNNTYSLGMYGNILGSLIIFSKKTNMIKPLPLPSKPKLCHYNSSKMVWTI